VRQAVLFYPGMEKIIAGGATILVEIGPHPALTPAVAAAFDAPGLLIAPTLKRDRQDSANLLGCLASLFVSGAPLNKERLFWRPEARKTALPLYPFRRERYWLEPNGMFDLAPETYSLMTHAGSQEDLPELPELHPLLGKALAYTSRKAVFETRLKTSSPWTDHRVLDATVFPGTAYLEMAARGFAALNGQSWRAVEIKEMVYERPLLLSYREEKTLQLTLENTSNGKAGAKFKITSGGDNPITYCRGRIMAAGEPQAQVALPDELARREMEMKASLLYGELRLRGLEYGARFANVRELWLGQPGSGEALGRVALAPAAAGSQPDPHQNAVLLDSCLHVFGAALGTLSGLETSGAFVPATIQGVTLRGELPAQVWSHVRISASRDGQAALANIRILSDEGALLAELANLELRRTLTMGSQAGRAAQGGDKAASSQAFKTRSQLLEALQPLGRQARISQLSKWLSTEIKDTLGQAAEGLNIDQLPPSTAFLEIGLDSLLVTELQRRIQEKLEFRFKPMQGLGYQSIESLAEFLLDEVLYADKKSQVPVSEPA
jgi:acyl transferase domain-containing protein